MINVRYYAVETNENHLEHYGVLGMKWGVHRSKFYNAKANFHTKRGNKLQNKANEKRNRFMNTTNRKIKYATKEQRYANAEKFHNKKALGLSYTNKLFGKTVDYKYNKSRAAKDAIMKEKYSEAKTGTTNSVNRLEYRSGKQYIKANKALLKKRVIDLKVSNAKKEEIDREINKYLGKPVSSITWTTDTSYKDKHAKLEDYVSKNQRVL